MDKKGFIPTTAIWDVGQQVSGVDNPQMQEFLVQLYQQMNTMAFAINRALGSMKTYSLDEEATSDIWIDERPVYRKVIDFGLIPSGNTSKPHGITATGTLEFIKIYGIARRQTVVSGDREQHIPLVFAYGNNVLGHAVSLSATDTDVWVQTPTNVYANHYAHIILEYVK